MIPGSRDHSPARDRPAESVLRGRVILMTAAIFIRWFFYSFNVQAQGCGAALSRGTPWSAVLCRLARENYCAWAWKITAVINP